MPRPEESTGLVSRTDVASVPFEQMSAELRALIAYEQNRSLDIAAPQGAIDRIRRDTPVVSWEFGHGFFSHADIVAATRNADLVSVDPNTGVPVGMGSREPLIPLQLDGEPHRRYRRLLNPLLSPDRVASLEGQLAGLAEELIDGFISKGEVEFFEAYANRLPCTAFMRLFGMPMDDYDFLIDCKDGILTYQPGESLADHEALAVAIGDRLDERLALRLAERRASGERRDDLIDSFLHFELEGEQLSDVDIVSIMHLFSIAGLDTVTSTLSCIVGWLAVHPKERRRVMADSALVPNLVEELLRFESPVPSGAVRYATADTKVNGVPIRRGELIYVCWAAGNLDPAVFNDPLTVDLDRSENRHLTFASGIHRCVGSHLARLELRVAIERFHEGLDDYWVTPGEDVTYEFHGVRSARHVPLTFRQSDRSARG